MTASQRCRLGISRGAMETRARTSRLLMLICEYTGKDERSQWHASRQNTQNGAEETRGCVEGTRPTQYASSPDKAEAWWAPTQRTSGKQTSREEEEASQRRDSSAQAGKGSGDEGEGQEVACPETMIEKRGDRICGSIKYLPRSQAQCAPSTQVAVLRNSRSGRFFWQCEQEPYQGYSLCQGLYNTSLQQIARHARTTEQQLRRC